MKGDRLKDPAARAWFLLHDALSYLDAEERRGEMDDELREIRAGIFADARALLRWRRVRAMRRAQGGSV